MTGQKAPRVASAGGRDEYKAAAEDAVDAMLRIPAAEARFGRDWPHDGCEFAAIAIAGVLADRGLLDGWVMVSGRRPGAVNGHSWLELRTEDGSVLYAIDPSLHQFPEWDEPHIGPGETPAAGVFTSRTDFLPLEWPYIGIDGEPYRVTLGQVRGILAA